MAEPASQSGETTPTVGSSTFLFPEPLPIPRVIIEFCDRVSSLNLSTTMGCDIDED